MNKIEYGLIYKDNQQELLNDNHEFKLNTVKTL